MMVRISSVVLVVVALFRSSVVAKAVNSTGWAEDVVVDGMAALGCEMPEEVAEEVVDQIIDLCIDAFKALGKAFTHDRTITVTVETPDALNEQFERHDEYKDDGVEFGWEHTDKGLALTYHNDGPISGCQGFKLKNCGWELYVAASNPLVGHNKARVAFVAPNSNRDCHNVWDTMDSWGETDSNVDKNDYGDVYDNPSSISYKLRDVPAECLKGSDGWTGPVDTVHCYSDDDCLNVGNSDQNDKQGCFDACDAIDRCNAVNWDDDKKHCVARNCEGDKATHPSGVVDGSLAWYRGTSSDGWNGPVDPIHSYNDDDCTNVGNSDQDDKQGCFDACDAIDDCNAVCWDELEHHCVARKCDGDKALHPSGEVYGYLAYYKGGSLKNFAANGQFTYLHV